ncbi:MAG: type II toxin-antitoxin system VapB family antitoxin [Actinomycetota bacterium]
MTRRTTIEIDDEKLAQAQEALGTKGLRDTVERAFDEAIRAHLRRRLAERIRTGEGVDFSEEVLEQSRRWR